MTPAQPAKPARTDADIKTIRAAIAKELKATGS